MHSPTLLLLLLLLLFPALARASEPSDLHQVMQGKATFYKSNGSGHCSFPPSQTGMFVAVASQQYNGSILCGACAKVWREGSRPEEQAIYLPVVDECPTCPDGGIDLSPKAFATLAAPSVGILPIQWRIVPCPTESIPAFGTLAFQLRPASTAHYFALLVSGAPMPITQVHASVSGAWSALERSIDNFWTATNGLGLGPYSIRVTMLGGAQVEDHTLSLSPGAIVHGSTRILMDQVIQSVAALGCEEPACLATAAASVATAAIGPSAPGLLNALKSGNFTLPTMETIAEDNALSPTNQTAQAVSTPPSTLSSSAWRPSPMLIGTLLSLASGWYS